MKRLIFIVLVIFCAIGLKAQNNFQQFVVGAGAGIATAYAGAPVNKAEPAFNGSAAYYITPFFNVGVQGQTGKLAGGAVTNTNLSFTNNYQAAAVTVTVQSGIIFRDNQTPFTDIVKGIYVGSGYGFIHNRVNLTTGSVTTYHHNKTPMVPIILGYEINLISDVGRPRLKLDFSYSYNATFGRGLDGYFGPIPQSLKLYTYYGVQLKYAINLTEVYGHRRSKFD